MVNTALGGLYDELLDLVPARLHHEFGEVSTPGAPLSSSLYKYYLPGFNPGGDPSNAALHRYTIGFDLRGGSRPGTARLVRVRGRLA